MAGVWKRSDHVYFVLEDLGINTSWGHIIALGNLETIPII